MRMQRERSKRRRSPHKCSYMGGFYLRKTSSYVRLEIKVYQMILVLMAGIRRGSVKFPLRTDPGVMDHMVPGAAVGCCTSPRAPCFATHFETHSFVGS